MQNNRSVNILHIAVYCPHGNIMKLEFPIYMDSTYHVHSLLAGFALGIIFLDLQIISTYLIERGCKIFKENIFNKKKRNHIFIQVY